jgi:hypothetical protein
MELLCLEYVGIEEASVNDAALYYITNKIKKWAKYQLHQEMQDQKSDQTVKLLLS